jgi:hypothetical protein
MDDLASQPVIGFAGATVWFAQDEHPIVRAIC